MNRWKFFDNEAQLSVVASLIMAEDIVGLEKSLGKEWQLNKEFALTGLPPRGDPLTLLDRRLF